MFLQDAKGFEYVFKEPYRYIWLFLGLIFINLTYSASLSNLYLWMILSSIGIWLILKAKNKESIDLNASHGNTLQSMTLAGVFLVIFMGICVLNLSLFQNYFSSPGFVADPTFNTFLSQNSAAFLGASQEPILAHNIWIGLAIFGVIIPIIETELVIRVLDFLLLISGVSISSGKFSLLKEPKFWASSFVISVIMVWYHTQAKGIGATAIIPQLFVFIFFFMSLIIASVPIVGNKREGETATWLHIYNNVAAVTKTLGII